jgi:hypothetical protein
MVIDDMVVMCDGCDGGVAGEEKTPSWWSMVTLVLKVRSWAMVSGQRSSLSVVSLVTHSLSKRLGWSVSAWTIGKIEVAGRDIESIAAASSLPVVLLSFPTSQPSTVSSSSSSLTFSHILFLGITLTTATVNTSTHSFSCSHPLFSARAHQLRVV